MKPTDNKIALVFQPRPRTLGGVPFAWQDRRVIELIQETFSGQKRTTAIAIYQTLTDLASRAGRLERKHTSQFRAIHKIIGEKSGKSVSTIKRYAGLFRNLGILTWKQEKNGYMNKPNLWILLDYPGHYREPTPNHNHEPRTAGHNNEPQKEERTRKYLNNKDGLKYSRTNTGFQSFKDIVEQRGEN